MASPAVFGTIDFLINLFSKDSVVTGGMVTKGSSTMLERITNNDLAAVRECIDAYGGWVWAVAKKHSDGPLAAEKLTVLIFRDIWKYAHRFKTSGLEEAVFMALIALRHIRPQPVVESPKFRFENKFLESFRKFASGDPA